MKLFYSAILTLSVTTGSAWAGLEGNFNTAYGLGAGFSAGDLGESTFIGRDAGYNTTGYSNTFLGASAGRSNTTGNYNVFLGNYAGYSSTTGAINAFFGSYAGYYNTTGTGNTVLGYNAGHNNTAGRQNVFVGAVAGFYNSTGNSNASLGDYAGYNNITGSGNVFLGSAAGYSELGSNKLYIANSTTATPLIYGEFDNKKITLNGNLEVVGPDFGIVELSDIQTNNATKGARLVLTHYTNAEEPVYLFGAASTPTQNFVAFGGGNVIGNAATQLDLFTAPNTTTPAGTPRLTIIGNGNIGIGTQTPLYPLQMASGALVTSGGVWTNASSREYKENIGSLSHKEATLTLAALDPVKFNYKADKENHHVGFIAEDVPELVATKDRKGLSPMDIVAVLTKVVKEQQRVNDEQQALIIKLSADVRALQKGVFLGGTIANSD